MWRSKTHMSRPCSTRAAAAMAGPVHWPQVVERDHVELAEIHALDQGSHQPKPHLRGLSCRDFEENSQTQGWLPHVPHDRDATHVSQKISVMVHRDPPTLLTQIALYHQLSPPAFLQLLERQFWVVHGINIHQVGGIRIVHCVGSLLLIVCPVREPGPHSRRHSSVTTLPELAGW